MHKRIPAIAVGALLSFGLASAATAGHNDDPVPGPNGHNNHGLCTALFNGSETGREHKADAPPFKQLIETGGGDLAKTWTWCMDAANNPKKIGGTPTEPGSTSADSKPKDRRG